MCHILSLTSLIVTVLRSRLYRICDVFLINFTQRIGPLLFHNTHFLCSACYLYSTVFMHVLLLTLTSCTTNYFCSFHVHVLVNVHSNLVNLIVTLMHVSCGILGDSDEWLINLSLCNICTV